MIQRKYTSLVKNLFWTGIMMIFAMKGWCDHDGQTGKQGLVSFDTGYTITKVRTGQRNGQTVIFAASYEGILFCFNFAGRREWNRVLSGFMVHDLWPHDLDRDGSDELLVACADGYLYCLDGKNGEILWTFSSATSVHKTPMYAVCTVRDRAGNVFIACGNFDKNLYYLNTKGQKLKTVRSSLYSRDIPWGDAKAVGYGHAVNFLRPVSQPDGGEHLALVSMMNHMQSPGSLYLFKPLAEIPYFKTGIPGIKTCNTLTLCDTNGDGTEEIIFGGSGLTNDPATFFDPVTGEKRSIRLRGNGPNGYRVTMVTPIGHGLQQQYLVLCGKVINLLPLNLDTAKVEKVVGKYAFYDLWKEPSSGKVILASVQSGGSCIHILDPSVPGWKQAFQNLEPPGKIRKIKENLEHLHRLVEQYQPPPWERKPDPVYVPVSDHPLVEKIRKHYASPVFFHQYWGRGHVENTKWRYRKETYVVPRKYREGKDRRCHYDLEQNEVVKQICREFELYDAVEFWAGHGNDPLYYSPQTILKILKSNRNRKTFLVWPELHHDGKDFQWIVDNIFYRLAKESPEHNAWLVFKSKNIFWSAFPYLPVGSRLLSGEFAAAFCSSMEETTDKTQDISLAARIGLWVAGCMDQWGMRTSRDNPSFDRSRQFSYQCVPNHFLRTTVYSLAWGARYCGNRYWDSDHFSILWPLIAKGILFVPRRNEILSFSPVHLSMKTPPDQRYLKEGTDVKWTIFYDEQTEIANPLVFSHMNGSWPAAALTPWDYSRYASGIQDRRQNFMPPTPYGMVPITPVQQGIFVQKKRVRKSLADYLHPYYRDKLQEFITDGRYYYTADGTERYEANSRYYHRIESAIRDAARLLPLNVQGTGVAWACAQTASTHLRLTLVDGGYLNPADRTATIIFHTVKPVKIRDILDHSIFPLKDGNTVKVPVPMGAFRFLDIELAEPLPHTGKP